MDQIENYANGSYSTSDDGGSGDIFALVPRIYPVPDYLAEYFDLGQALRVATNTCVLQQGKCWVIKRSSTLPRVGQRCGRGECQWRSRNSPGLSGLGADLSALRAGRSGGTPIALVTSKGLAAVRDDEVLPLWRAVFRVSEDQHFIVQGPSQTYSAAVRAAMWLANHSGKRKLVYGMGQRGRPVPMVYVEPGGLVRSAPLPRGNETQVDLMDNFELRQAIAASAGASIMPHGM